MLVHRRRCWPNITIRKINNFTHLKFWVAVTWHSFTVRHISVSSHEYIGIVQWIKCSPKCSHIFHWTSAVFSHIVLKMNPVGLHHIVGDDLQYLLDNVSRFVFADTPHDEAFIPLHVLGGEPLAPASHLSAYMSSLQNTNTDVTLSRTRTPDTRTESETLVQSFLFSGILGKHMEFLTTKKLPGSFIYYVYIYN